MRGKSFPRPVLLLTHNNTTSIFELIIPLFGDILTEFPPKKEKERRINGMRGSSLNYSREGGKKDPARILKRRLASCSPNLQLVSHRETRNSASTTRDSRRASNFPPLLRLTVCHASRDLPACLSAVRMHGAGDPIAPTVSLEARVRLKLS